MTTFLLRIMFDEDRRLGPGKIALLEAIAATGSISGAARAMGMSYRRAWLLLDATNAMFAEPVAETSQGGQRGGGAQLTPFGRQVIERYQAIEKALRLATAGDVAFLEQHLRRGAR
jgi:molybdate transport system regulatory protein